MCFICELRNMANNMNNNKLWSDSLTKNSLTTYAEGLACDNFDKRTIYNVWRNDVNTWWVLKKQQVLLQLRHMNQLKCYMIE